MARRGPQISIDRLVLRALDEMGIAWNPESHSGVNIEKFIQIARAYSSMTLGEFISHLESIARRRPSRDRILPSTKPATPYRS